MTNEEYAFPDVENYLFKSVNLLLCGFPTKEERSTFFKNKWSEINKAILCLERVPDDKIHYMYFNNNTLVHENNVDLCIGLPKLLKCLHIENSSVLLDMSSLDNVLIMFLTKKLLTQVIPRALFASYIRPKSYLYESGDVGFALSDQILAVEAVPGFAKRENNNQTICAFLGFEGVRLKGVLETVHSFNKLIPIVALPSGSPHWHQVALWNSMDTLQSVEKNLSLCNCFSESVFDAVKLLNDIIQQDETVVLAPLGTRPHSMACAIYACQHDATRIVYDFVVENKHRAVGIEDITIYHLSNFIKS